MTDINPLFAKEVIDNLKNISKSEKDEKNSTSKIKYNPILQALTSIVIPAAYYAIISIWVGIFDPKDAILVKAGCSWFAITAICVVYLCQGIYRIIISNNLNKDFVEAVGFFIIKKNKTKQKIEKFKKELSDHVENSQRESIVISKSVNEIENHLSISEFETHLHACNIDAINQKLKQILESKEFQGSHSKNLNIDTFTQIDAYLESPTPAALLAWYRLNPGIRPLLATIVIIKK